MFVEPPQQHCNMPVITNINTAPSESATVGPVDIVETSQTTSRVFKATSDDGTDDSKKVALLVDEETGSDNDKNGLMKPSNAKPLKEKVIEHSIVKLATILGCCGLPKVLAVSLAAGAGITVVVYLTAPEDKL
jgi:hypothetical protein